MKLAIIGDVHGAWDQQDAEWFNGSDYDALLATGDLAPLGRFGRGVRAARSMAGLRLPAWCAAGNHDGPTLAHMAAEVVGLGRRTRLGVGLIERRYETIRAALGQVVLGAYTHHRLAEGIGLVCGRPCSMGGPRLAFPAWLERRFGVRTVAESARRLCETVDACPDETLVFLAHNGPTGLGAAPTDIWGCDFKRGGGDWGDPDLRAALDHALASGRRVLAVIAGHMHLRTRQRQPRTWYVERDGIHYINPARVPRVFARDGQRRRQHVRWQLPGAPSLAEVVGGVMHPC